MTIRRKRKKTVTAFRSYKPYKNPCYTLRLPLYAGIGPSLGYSRVYEVEKILLEHEIRHHLSFEYVTETGDSGDSKFAVMCVQIARGQEEKAVMLRLLV